MASERNDKPESKDYHAWFDRLREAVRSSIDEVEDSFDEKERLRKQVGVLQQENKMLMEDVKKIQDEKAGLEAENDRLRRQVGEMRPLRNASVDELALKLNRIDIDADSADKRTQFAQVLQRRFKDTREELQDRVRQLAQENPQSRLAAVGYAIRCADILLNSRFAVSNTQGRKLFFESLVILDKHIRALNTRLRKLSETNPYFQLVTTSEPVSCSLMLLTLPPPTRTKDQETEWTTAQLRAELTIKVNRTEAISRYNMSFRRTCALLVCKGVPIAKSISGRTDYAGGRAFRMAGGAGIRFLNQSYWHDQSLLLGKELEFRFHQQENFHASHVEIHLMAFLFRESRLHPSVHLPQTSEVEQLIMKRSMATIYVSQKPCDCCKSFREVLRKMGLSIDLRWAPILQNC